MPCPALGVRRYCSVSQGHQETGVAIVSLFYREGIKLIQLPMLTRLGRDAAWLSTCPFDRNAAREGEVRLGKRLQEDW